MFNTSEPPDRSDVIVVGAGILGLAVAREFLLRHPATVVKILDKENRIAAHQTGHNSGVIHSGIYYRPGSLKATLCLAGARLLYEYCEDRRIAVERCGKVIVATTPAELPRLKELHRRGVANRVVGLEEIEGNRLAEIEPHVSGVRALYVPSTGIVDFKEVARALAADAENMGATISTGVQVLDIRPGGDGATIKTSQGLIHSRYVITCGGLYSDRLATMTGAPASPRIVPFRGSYYKLRASARPFVNGLVYPVPDPAFPFLGAHFTKQISGEVWAGPNAVVALAREGYRRWHVHAPELWEMIHYRGFRKLAMRYWRVGLAEWAGELSKARFVDTLRRLVPEISTGDIVPGPSGVRAQAVSTEGVLLDDFWFDPAPGVIHVRNAPSPGATSSLAIARFIVERAESEFHLR